MSDKVALEPIAASEVTILVDNSVDILLTN